MEIKVMGPDWRGSNHNNRAKKTNEANFFGFPPNAGKKYICSHQKYKGPKNS